MRYSQDPDLEPVPCNNGWIRPDPDPCRRYWIVVSTKEPTQWYIRQHTWKGKIIIELTPSHNSQAAPLSTDIEPVNVGRILKISPLVKQKAPPPSSTLLPTGQSSSNVAMCVLTLEGDVWWPKMTVCSVIQDGCVHGFKMAVYSDPRWRCTRIQDERCNYWFKMAVYTNLRWRCTLIQDGYVQYILTQDGGVHTDQRWWCIHRIQDGGVQCTYCPQTALYLLIQDAVHTEPTIHIWWCTYWPKVVYILTPGGFVQNWPKMQCILTQCGGLHLCKMTVCTVHNPSWWCTHWYKRAMFAHTVPTLNGGCTYWPKMAAYTLTQDGGTYMHWPKDGVWWALRVEFLRLHRKEETPKLFSQLTQRAPEVNIIVSKDDLRPNKIKARSLWKPLARGGWVGWWKGTKPHPRRGRGRRGRG